MKKRMLLVGADMDRTFLRESFSEEFRNHWEIYVVGNGAQALDLMDHDVYEVVIADLRLPDQSGIQLLEDTAQKWPQASRYVLADLTDRQALMKCVGTAHQFLSKPCDSAKLEKKLERASFLEAWFGNGEVKNLVTQMRKVPSPPCIYFQIVRELQSLTVTMENIGAIISQDMAVTAKLLQMVNSAAFGLQRTVSSPAEAVTFLGIETTKSLVLLAHTYSHFDRIPSSIFSVDTLWRHSLAVGRLARALSRYEQSTGEEADQAFTAGLLHDMGKLVLAANRPEEYVLAYQASAAGKQALWESEQQAFGATHAEVGGWLAAIWGLPIKIVEALVMHHAPARFLSSGFSPLAAVHVANVLEHEANRAEPGGAPSDLDEGFLENLGWSERVEEWRGVYRELMPQHGSAARIADAA